MTPKPFAHHRPHPDHPPGARASTVAAVAIGGAAGAAARYGAELIWPDSPAAFPWTVLLINVVGCFLMGILMVTVKLRLPGAHPLVSPLLGTGVLGGFTSFSHYVDDVRELFDRGQPGYAVGCLLLTVVAALTAVTVGAFATHALLGGRVHSREGA